MIHLLWTLPLLWWSVRVMGWKTVGLLVAAGAMVMLYEEVDNTLIQAVLLGVALTFAMRAGRIDTLRDRGKDQ